MRWRDPEVNMERAAAMMEGAAAGADLVVLPEMFTTGFDLDPTAGEQEGRSALEWMKRQAARYDAAVAGSVVWMEDGKLYNRLLFVKPDGGWEYYDKHHLFTFAGEQKRFAAGERRVAVEWRGVRILLQVCYDLRFPVFARNRDDYDMILYVADWPKVRAEAWELLLRARAVENVCYVAGVNRAGSDPAHYYGGGSAFVDFKGREIVRADEGETLLEAEADMQALRVFRERFPALGDADDFTIEGI